MNPDLFWQDPIALADLLWPDVRFYDKQRQVLESVVRNDETVVVAGHMLGKDFVTAFVVLWFFLTRRPCRVVTTSVDETQLNGVLWGELRRFIQTSAWPLDSEKGGPLLVNDLQLRWVFTEESRRGQVCPLSYVIGRVAKKGEGMQGHHIARTGDGVPRTLFVADEASGVDDGSYLAADTWAERVLVIGNPYDCQNFFRRAVKEGDVVA
jgi:phage terminase large subunit